MKRAAPSTGSHLPRRRKYRLLALALVMIVVFWVIYLPGRLYRPFCYDKPFRDMGPFLGIIGVFGGRDDMPYFSPEMSPEYREHLGNSLRTSGVLHVSLGPYVIVPVIGVLNDDTSWNYINDIAVIASINRYRNAPDTHPRMMRVVLDYTTARKRRIKEKGYPKEEYQKYWCAVVEAVVTPGWVDRENDRSADRNE